MNCGTDFLRKPILWLWQWLRYSHVLPRGRIVLWPHRRLCPHIWPRVCWGRFLLCEGWFHSRGFLNNSKAGWLWVSLWRCRHWVCWNLLRWKFWQMNIWVNFYYYAKQERNFVTAAVMWPQHVRRKSCSVTTSETVSVCRRRNVRSQSIAVLRMTRLQQQTCLMKNVSLLFLRIACFHDFLCHFSGCSHHRRP